MTEEKYVYLIAELDDEANVRMEALFQMLLKAGLPLKPRPNIPYHITVGQFSPQDSPEALVRAENACGETNAFSVSLSNLGLFGERVLFIAPAVNCELMALHNAVSPDVPAQGAHDWVPHITLLMDEPRENILRAIPLVAEAFTPFATKVERVSIYEYPPEKFLVRFPLQNNR